MSDTEPISARLAREKTAPFLIRSFVKVGTFHRLSLFEEGALPTTDEHQLFTWKDATLREVLTTLRNAAPHISELKHPLARYSFRAIYADGANKGRFAQKELGIVYSRDILGEPGSLESPAARLLEDTDGEHREQTEREKEERTLEELRFVPGDYLCVSIILPKGAAPSVPQGDVAAKQVQPNGWRPSLPGRVSDGGWGSGAHAPVGRGGGHWRGDSNPPPLGGGRGRGGRMGDFAGRDRDYERAREPERRPTRRSPPPHRGGRGGRGGRRSPSYSRSRSPPRRRASRTHCNAFVLDVDNERGHTLTLTSLFHVASKRAPVSMGSSLSRPSKSYPFPMPGTDSSLSKPSMWSFSIKKRSKKGNNKHEELDDFIVSKYPTPTTTYGLPYYPQMPSAFPAYYAPVQMALVQPLVQQPLLGMPQAFLPMTYQTTAAPVQPAVAPVIPAMQMPNPAPAPVPTSAVPLAPAPPLSSAPPPTAPTQMPQPYPPHPPSSQGPPLASSPIPAEPVIPPPPIIMSEPPRPDSGRIRFTDFYRPADVPPARRPSVDTPVRPPTAGLAGRTPYSGPTPLSMPSSTPSPMPIPSSTPAPIPMPTPRPSSGHAPIQMSHNPLPRPPADVWDSSPYRQVLANLPGELPDLLDFAHRTDVIVGDPEPVPRPSSRLGSLFGSRDKGKKPLRGLFRSRSTSGQNDLGIGSSRHGHGHSRSQTLTSIVIPPAGPGTSGPSTMNMPQPNMGMPVPSVGPPIKFDHTGEFSGFVNHSHHRVMYKNKMYPTALHLLEAMKFIHQPALQERIRTCKDVLDMYPLSASFQEHVRSDWGQVFLKAMEEVLYLKFKQHPTLRALLLRTGLADIIYSDENKYWGDGPLGNGANELGKALVRLRERLRQEGDN